MTFRRILTSLWTVLISSFELMSKQNSVGDHHWWLMIRVVLGVLGLFLFCAQNMPHTSSIYHPNAHPHWSTWLRRRPFFMIFFRQIFRFFKLFFCLELPGVARLYCIIPWHLSNISRVCGFRGTLWKKSCDRLKIIIFWKK